MKLVLESDIDAMSHAGKDLLQLVEEARQLVQQQAQLHEELLEDGPGGAAERSLVEALDARKTVEAALGHSLIRWLALGGHLELRAPGETLSEQPSPSLAPFEDDAVDVPTPEPEPEPLVPVALTPEPKAASKAQLQALLSKGMTPNWPGFKEQQQRVQHAKVLRRLFRTLDKPGKIKTQGAATRGVEALTRAVASADTWLELPRAWQKMILGMLSSMARYIQDECRQTLNEPHSSDLRTLFSTMTHWSGVHRPGFVPGLSRHNTPEFAETWLEEATHWWKALHAELEGPEGVGKTSPETALSELAEDLQGISDSDSLSRSIQAVLDTGLSQSDRRLVQMLLPHQEMCRGIRGLKTLKTALRTAVKVESEEPRDEDEDEASLSVPEELLALTRGKVAALAGGDPRQHAIRRIRDTFEFSEVMWEPTEKRRTQALQARIKSGSVDVLFVLRRFIGHTDFSDLCNLGAEVGITVCMIDHGYGVTQLGLALEKALL